MRFSTALRNSLTLSVFAAVCGVAAAQSTWTLDTARGTGAGQCAEQSPNGAYGNSWSCRNVAGNATLTASAWSLDRGRGTSANGTVVETTVLTGRSFNGSTWADTTTTVSDPNFRTTVVSSTSTASRTFEYRVYDGNNALISTGTSTNALNTLPTTSGARTVTSQYQGEAIAPNAGKPTFSSAFMNDQGGLGFGATNRTEALRSSAGGNHAFDSVTPGLTDMVLISFNSATILESFRMGWTGTDGDVSILRWTGDTAPGQFATSTTAVANDREVGLDATKNSGAIPGWQLVGHFDIAGGINNNGTTIDTNFTAGSSWWLISTFNTTLASNSIACSGCDAGDDAFKIEYLASRAYNCPSGQTVTPGGGCSGGGGGGGGGSVPEPGSLALAALAAGGLWFTRRRQLRK